MTERATIARPYAKAVFRFAAEHNDFAVWHNALIAMSEVMSSANARAYLRQPGLTPEAKSQWLQELLRGQLTDPAVRLLDVLAKNGRLEALPDIAVFYDQLQKQAQNTTVAEVITSHPLSEATNQRLRESLAKKYNSNIELNESVDPKLMGGAVVRVGDEVLDGSVRGKLNKLKQTLLVN